ncbi:outer membrane protein assembly factor BamC [Idiomarina xiamenensis]|uniref:Outer membrane protein assembly factor BamC n=1 Tax=Idiomarina xiamenensis 10-D-4 TaxID=740709 RepID=K2JTU6_9GAMM|nr:outer membrane protein assembly factor BamC [Idiomarina xiamenensis]EKE86866.1 hypothetical protein A10D4_01452 [Idiomarina xiamenensis 10-D-4]
MRLAKVTTAILAALAVTACSSNNRERAQGDFDYTQAQTSADLKAPSGLELPANSDSYEIPVGENSSGPVGQDVNVTAPIQVRPIAAGSRVDENETQVRVFFDEVEDFDNIAAQVWQALETTLTELGVSTSNEQTETLLQTDWIAPEVVFAAIDSDADDGWSWWPFGDDEVEQVRPAYYQFVVTMNTEPHGRTTSLLVDTIAFKRPGTQQQMPTAKAQRNAETLFLNAVITEVNRMQQRHVIERQRSGISTELGFNADGDPAYIIDSDFESAWAVTGLMLEALNFDVDDLNKSSGRYYVSYEKPSSGFLSALWGSSNDLELPLAETDYQVVLIEQGERTSLTIEQNGEALPANVVSDMFATIAEQIKQQSMR